MNFDFAKHKHVDAIDDIPEDFRPLYAGDDESGYDLDSDHDGVKAAVAVIMKMNGALKAARQEAKNKPKPVDLSALSEFGETPEDIAVGVKEAIEAAGKGKSADLEKRVSSAKEALQAAHGKELQKKDDRIQKLTKSLTSTLIEANAVVALNRAGAIEPSLLMPIVNKRARVIENDEGFTHEILDEKGEPMYSGTTGGAATMEDLALELAGTDRLKSLFKSKSKDGGGTKPGDTSRRTAPPRGREMSAVEKIDAGLRKGQHKSGVSD